MPDPTRVSKNSALTPPPRPTLALPPRPAARRGLWALPLVLSLAFVVVVLSWLRSTQQAETEEQRTELISDALSLQAQVTTHIESESALLQDFATGLERRQLSAEGFKAAPEVQQGLHRFWVGLTWLDASNRIVAHVPEQSPRPDLPSLAGAGLSAHLMAPLPSGGALVARYSPSEMLRQTVPWWLARKYDVRLVDSFGAVMARPPTAATQAAAQPTASAWSPP